MENEVCYSPKEVFEKRALAVKEAQAAGTAIFTPDNYGAVVAVDEDMERRLTHSGLVHKDDMLQPPVKIDDEYSAVNFHATYNSIVRKMPEANKDEIFMFLSTADPNRLADQETQDALLTRVAEIQKRDMVKGIVEHSDPTAVAEENASEISAITSFFGAMKNATQVEGNFFAAGQTPDVQ